MSLMCLCSVCVNQINIVNNLNSKERNFMSTSSFILQVSKEAIRESNKTIQTNNSQKIVPLSQLNLLKKYPFDITIKKLKKGYQMLVFFNVKGNMILVYCTKRGDLELVTREFEPMSFFWNKKPKYKKTSIEFVNPEASKKFSNWCGKFRHYQQILDKWSQVRKCSDNF